MCIRDRYEIFRDARLGASYTRRWINYAIEDVSLDEARTYFIANPGYGLASAFPKAVRNYNAVTAQLSKSFSSGWLAQASYTWITLTGNYEGLINTFYGQNTDPNITASFDLQSLLTNASGRLPGSQTHAVKIFGGKEFSIGKRFSLGLFVSYIGRSGRPINYLGAHMQYGANMAFLLPMGSGGEMPWVHNLDIALTANVRIGAGVNLQFRIDALNFINLQGATALSQTFTGSNTLPLAIPAGKNPQVTACLAGVNQAGCNAKELPIKDDEGNFLARDKINPNFKLPTTFQDPFTARFSIRMTF